MLYFYHENPHRGFFGLLLEALVAMDANIDLINTISGQRSSSKCKN